MFQEFKYWFKMSVLFICFVLMPFFTFGYAANDINKRVYDPVVASIGGVIAGFAWPLYWSWEAQEYFYKERN